MEYLRTPDERFENLKDYDFNPNYLDVSGPNGTKLRMHYVDEGPKTAAPILLMHGEPSWSYLYRKFIPALVKSGHRVIAPDLIGFGKSDKPTKRSDYTYARHIAWMSDWLLQMDLKDITLFCQDWGGLIGLRLVAAFPTRFSRLLVGNTGLPTGSGFSEGFNAWLQFSQNSPQFPIGNIVKMGTVNGLTEDEIKAYDAPFPDDSYKEGAREFPALVPITPQHAETEENIAAWKILEQFEKPVLTCFSDQDKVTAGGEKVFISRIPGANHQKHCIVKGAGHFLQEDKPEELVGIIENFIRSDK
jgi:haloalkane dehalogenase